ncbi:MAG: complex I NDUFA9 subunit family protein [Rhodobacteraceae bacterium]|nr:MAG: complex I NDUFA9 subunit family protein [Paracoccaceae bacterium]
MSKLVTIFGGSGFVGRYVARRMALQGWRVKVATRRPNEAMFVKPYGVVGQVEPVLCNIRDENSVAAAISGADAVVNCVGIRNETGANSFEAVHVDGAERVARLAAEAGVGRFVHLSALGIDRDSDSQFASSKARGEEAVLRHRPDAVILRPSAIFGTEDHLFNHLAALTRLGPVLPMTCLGTRLQPVYVDDLAAAAVSGVLGTADGIYELGGPEVVTLGEMVDQMLEVIHRKRVVMNMPRFMAWFVAFGLDMTQKMSFGLITNAILTRDQLRGLATDHVVSEGAKGFGDLGIAPVAMGTVLPDYLWRFRPSGQYDAIKQSAGNLRP